MSCFFRARDDGPGGRDASRDIRVAGSTARWRSTEEGAQAQIERFKHHVSQANDAYRREQLAADELRKAEALSQAEADERRRKTTKRLRF
ncbi:MAG: hypothetical protein Q8S00_17200 [Deltaproteobacteria bacterium]|nr:hypothetical protein [Deltaproteobacteria bacterium]